METYLDSGLQRKKNSLLRVEVKTAGNPVTPRLPSTARCPWHLRAPALVNPRSLEHRLERRGPEGQRRFFTHRTVLVWE